MTSPAPPQLTAHAERLLAGAARWPWHGLPPSARVDLLTMLAAPRPAMRTRTALTISELHEWSRLVRLCGWGLAADTDYAVIATSPRLAIKILVLDAAPGRHTLALGLALGYPACCAAAAECRGDDGLDDWARQQATAIPSGPLHTGQYLAGNALISHIPCGSGCSSSLEHAARASRLLPRLRAALTDTGLSAPSTAAG